MFRMTSCVMPREKIWQKAVWTVHITSFLVLLKTIFAFTVKYVAVFQWPFIWYSMTYDFIHWSTRNHSVENCHIFSCNKFTEKDWMYFQFNKGKNIALTCSRISESCNNSTETDNSHGQYKPKKYTSTSIVVKSWFPFSRLKKFPDFSNIFFTFSNNVLMFFFKWKLYQF